MNEFDELFEKTVQHHENDPETNVDDFYRRVNNQKRNGFLFLTYVIINIVFTFGALLWFSMAYPNAQGIVEDIVVVSDPDITINYDGENNPISATFEVTFLNSTDYDLQQIWVDLEFFNDAEESLGVYSFSQDDVVIGQSYQLSETFDIDFEPVSYEMYYGIEMGNSFYILLSFAQALIGSILFFIIDKEAFKDNWKAFKQQPGKYFGQIVTGFLIVFGALLVASYILDLLGVAGTSQNEETIRSYFTKDLGQIIMLFLLLCIFTPIVEEVIFRKVVYNFFEPRAGHIVAIIGTGVIFGLMHVITYGDFIQSIPYILMGIAFGYIYYRSKKNIYVTIGVHFLNNFMTFTIYILMLYGLY